jgi:hypothetical protein
MNALNVINLVKNVKMKALQVALYVIKTIIFTQKIIHVKTNA